MPVTGGLGGRLAAIAALVALGGAALASAKPRQATERAIAAVDSALAEVKRVQMESMLCLDQMDLAALVRATGGADPCESVIEEGDPSFGTIHSIGQLHKAMRPTSEYEDEIPVRYQLELLRLLEARKARTVFLEGTQAGEAIAMDEATAARYRDDFVDLVRPGGVDSLTLQQFWTLRRSLAGYVYKILHPRAEVLGADDTAAVGRVKREIGTLGILEGDSLVFERREHVAMEAVCRYLASHRGAEVYLVFGAAHIFERSSVPRGSPVPRILMTTFPGLAAAAPENQPWMLQRLRVEPRLVAAYLDSLFAFSPRSFETLDEAGQMLALKKEFLLTWDIADPDSLARYLGRRAKSERVRQAIARGKIASLPRSDVRSD